MFLKERVCLASSSLNRVKLWQYHEVYGHYSRLDHRLKGFVILYQFVATACGVEFPVFSLRLESLLT